MRINSLFRAGTCSSYFLTFWHTYTDGCLANAMLMSLRGMRWFNYIFWRKFDRMHNLILTMYHTVFCVVYIQQELSAKLISFKFETNQIFRISLEVLIRNCFKLKYTPECDRRMSWMLIAHDSEKLSIFFFREIFNSNSRLYFVTLLHIQKTHINDI